MCTTFLKVYYCQSFHFLIIWTILPCFIDCNATKPPPTFCKSASISHFLILRKLQDTTIYILLLLFLIAPFFRDVKMLLEFINCGGDVIVLVLLSLIYHMIVFSILKKRKVLKERDGIGEPLLRLFLLIISLPFPYHTYQIVSHLEQFLLRVIILLLLIYPSFSLSNNKLLKLGMLSLFQSFSRSYLFFIGQSTTCYFYLDSIRISYYIF